jgi:uncharacterized protein YgiM (DUF1202 family)
MDMNRLVLALAGLLCLEGAQVGAASAAAARRTIQVRETNLRTAPSFLSEIRGSLAYGDTVTVLETRSGWALIGTADALAGWIHQSALGKPRSGMRAAGGTMDTSATGDEVALAGKGFSAQVEQTYRTEHADTGFAWVDRMESLVVSQEEIRRFLAEGGLQASPRTGDRP